MASTSNNNTPVHQHPLSPEETPTKSRKARGGKDPASASRPTTSYFTLKAQNESEDPWDGSVRGLGRLSAKPSLEQFPSRQKSSSSLVNMFKPAPLIIVGGAATDTESTSPNTKLFPSTEGVAVASRVLATKWHEYSDEAIQTTIARLAVAETPAEVPSNPYHSALRVLSSALHNLSRVRIELEEQRKLIREKEDARRARAQELMKELKISEQDVARRVMQSIFTDDDEQQHRVRRQSFMVCTLQPDEDMF